MIVRIMLYLVINYNHEQEINIVNADKEKIFVQNFIVKNKKDRLIFELSDKKRQEGIGRFCHNTEDLLIQKKIIAKSDNMILENAEKTVHRLTSEKSAYIMAYNPKLGGISCELHKALEMAFWGGMPSIIIIKDIAFIKAEQSLGSPQIYFKLLNISVTKHRFFNSSILFLLQLFL